MRVLIVDDSPLVRSVLRLMLARFEDVTVVGEASDGRQAEGLVRDLAPDVVTMDVLMPLMGGMEAIEGIMARHPTPIVVVADPRGDERGLALDALARGAVGLYPKPSSGFTEDAARDLVQLLRAASRVQVRKASVAQSARRAPPTRPAPGGRGAEYRVVGIVASTGGPRMLKAILGVLPATFPCAVVLVQHTVPGFTAGLVSWLDSSTALHVCLAEAGQRLEPGSVVVAPGNVHLEIERGGFVRLGLGAPVDGHRPSGTRLLRSLAQAYRSHAVGVVLTGMGTDGADGIAAIEAEGGLAIVEDPETAIVDGMPRAALARTRNPVVDTGDALGSVLLGICGDAPA